MGSGGLGIALALAIEINKEAESQARFETPGKGGLKWKLKGSLESQLDGGLLWKTCESRHRCGKHGQTHEGMFC